MIDVDDLAAHLGHVTPLDPADALWAGQVVDAVNAYVATLPVTVDRPVPADPWPATVTTGAVMLAAHLYQSRNAPYGRATLDLVGTTSAVYADPEIARLLQLRRWSPPMVG